MENEFPYQRMNYSNINENLRNKKDINKQWIFSNYIGDESNNLNKYYMGNSLMPLPNEFNYNHNDDSIKSISRNNINNNDELSFDFKMKDKEIQMNKVKEQYRKDLLRQIEENEKRRKAKMREIDEENRINDIKNKEYLIYKQKQEEEYERLKRLKENKKMKSQFIIENQKYDISYYNTKRDNIENIRNINKSKNIITEEEEKKDILKEREKEKIINNYNKIIRSNYTNMFEEKQELLNYMNLEFSDFYNTLDNVIENDKKKEIYKDTNINKNLIIPDGYYKFKKDKGRYNLYSNTIHKNVDKKYGYIFEQISDVNDLTKSYQLKIKPSIYFNHDIDILLDSYSNMLLLNNNRNSNNYINEKINKLTINIKSHEAKEKENEKEKVNIILKENNDSIKKAEQNNMEKPNIGFNKKNTYKKEKEKGDLVIKMIDKKESKQNIETTEKNEEKSEEKQEDNDEVNLMEIPNDVSFNEKKNEDNEEEAVEMEIEDKKDNN